MFKKVIIPLIILQFVISQVFSQVSIKDSSIVVPMIYANYAYQLPEGGLAKRFGGNSSIGGGFMIKTRSNWLFAAEGNYIFGNNVKNGNSLSEEYFYTRWLCHQCQWLLCRNRFR